MLACESQLPGSTLLRDILILAFIFGAGRGYGGVGEGEEKYRRNDLNALHLAYVQLA